MQQRASTKLRLLDHLVGATGQRKRDSDAKRLGGLEVDDQLNFGDLLHRQVGGLLALENPTSVDAGQTELVRTVALSCGRMSALASCGQAATRALFC